MVDIPATDDTLVAREMMVNIVRQLHEATNEARAKGWNRCVIGVEGADGQRWLKNYRATIKQAPFHSLCLEVAQNVLEAEHPVRIWAAAAP